MNPLPNVAIVILNWNGLHFLQQFLPVLLQTNYRNYIVYVADNASTDHSVNFVKQNFPEVKIIVLEKNYGFAKGYNEALKLIDADYYLLLNSDVEVTPGWLIPMVDLMEHNKNIAACQPKILSWHNKTHFEYAGASGGWVDALGYPFARGRVFDYCEQDMGQYNNEAAVFWASGAAMLLRSAAFREAGGFDDYFFAHQEEIDLCWRLQRLGYAVYVCPAAVVYHVGGGTLPKGNSLKSVLNFRNSLIMLAKNLPVWQAVWKISLRLVLDGVAVIQSFSGKNQNLFLPVLKAHFQFYGWLLFWKDKQKTATSGKKPLSGMYKGSVVWQYFIKKKIKFEQIVVKKH